MSKLQGGKKSGLADAKQFIGHQGKAGAPSSVLMRHNGRHLDWESTVRIGSGGLAAANKKKVVLRDRSLKFLRNAGHLMNNPAILYNSEDGG